MDKFKSIINDWALRHTWSGFVIICLSLQLFLMIQQASFVSGVCTDSVCSAACNLMTLNNNGPGHCNTSYINPNFSNDPSCICDNCPPASYLDLITIHNFNRTCVGPPLQTNCTSCPTNTASDQFVPHKCTLTDPATTTSQTFCVCMCADGISTVCPFLPIIG